MNMSNLNVTPESTVTVSDHSKTGLTFTLKYRTLIITELTAK